MRRLRNSSLKFRKPAHRLASQISETDPRHWENKHAQLTHSICLVLGSLPSHMKCLDDLNVSILTFAHRPLVAPLWYLLQLQHLVPWDYKWLCHLMFQSPWHCSWKTSDTHTHTESELTLSIACHIHILAIIFIFMSLYSVIDLHARHTLFHHSPDECI